MVEPMPDPVLTNLQQIQGTLAEIGKVQAEHTKRFDRLEHRIADLQDSVFSALGLAGNASIQHRSVQTQIETLTDRLSEIDDLKARIARLEEKV